MDDLGRRLRRVEDRLELRELVTRYAIAIDDRDWDALATLFAPEARVRTAHGGGQCRDEVVAYYRSRLTTYGVTFHYPHGQVVEFVDDDEATGQVQAHAEVDVGGTSFYNGLRYRDHYVRRDGRWCFLERINHTIYAAPHADFDHLLGASRRNRRPGTEPRVGDLPEGLPTWTPDAHA